MLFNSVQFTLFLPLVFGLYWWLAGTNITRQNVLLLASSYFFYACWDPRFLALLLFSTLLDFFSGQKIHRAQNQRTKSTWLWLSTVANLGFLGLFKYYNFFAESFAQAISLLGIQTNPATLNIILPVGISFYTFHGLSYVLDVYKKRIAAENNPIDYAVFVSFFPLLVAGPIERANHLLPQIKTKRTFNYDQAVDGLRQILWGFFKKLVIADNCAVFANQTFGHSAEFSGSTLALGAVFFAFQIYGDFSGYSDIALGTARLFGIELLRNFSFPYFSRDIAEFWRRWHISLSSWFRDYVYIPMGGSRVGIVKKIRNVFLIFILSGFWHGANWTFIVWGALHAAFFLPLMLMNRNSVHTNIVANGRVLPTVKELFQILLTFSLTAFAWIFFRSDDLKQALNYVSGMVSGTLFTLPAFEGTTHALSMVLLLVFFVIIEWVGREKQCATESMQNSFSRPVRWSFYVFIIYLIGMFAKTEVTPFIYFQF